MLLVMVECVTVLRLFYWLLKTGVRLRLAEQINHCAYGYVAQQIAQTTGARVAKRQCLNLVQNMAQDFEVYYLQNRYLTPEPGDDLLVLTFNVRALSCGPIR